MAGGVEVTIEVEPAAAALADDGMRAFVGRMVSRMLRPPATEDRFRAIERLKADAHARGLTDAIVDEELAAHKAERLRQGLPSA